MNMTVAATLTATVAANRVIQKHARMRHKRLWFLGLRKGSTLIQRSWRRS